jgi:spore coat polysaccharide biosynthesis predicted glycosyltransferase SpsG
MPPPGLLVVYTEGDRVRGLGHVSRCIAWADGWARRGGRVLWVLDGDPAAAAMIAPGQEIQISRWQNGANGAAVERAAQVTLVDSYSVTRDTAAAIAATTGATVYVDDLWKDWPPGVVVHAAPDRRPDDAAAPDPATTWLTGPTWHPLRAPFVDLTPCGPARRTIRRVLVVFGGGDLRRVGATMADLALQVCEGAEVDLVLGAGQEPPPASRGLTVHQAIDATAMAQLMLEADVAISGAGQTIFELARCGTPTVMVGIADNQRANLEQWPSLCGFIDAGSWHGADLLDRVRNGLVALGPAPARQKISDRAHGIVDGQGVRRLFYYLGQVSGETGQFPDRFGQAESSRVE